MPIPPDEAIRFRLTPGTSVLAGAHGWTVHTPTQELLEIDCPEHDRPPVSSFFESAATEPFASHTDVVAPLIEYLVEERALEAVDASWFELPCRVWSSPGLDPDVLDAVLEQQAIVRTDSPTTPLVAIADHLPDARWCALDEASVDGDVWWVPVYAEGETWYAGPLRPGATEGAAGYRDLRIRRLAASPCPERLDELWRSGVSPAARVRRVSAHAAALECALGALRSLWRAHQDASTGSPNGSVVQLTPDAPLINRQAAFHHDGSRRDHPVLPVPLHLAREPLPGAGDTS